MEPTGAVEESPPQLEESEFVPWTEPDDSPDAATAAEPATDEFHPIIEEYLRRAADEHEVTAGPRRPVGGRHDRRGWLVALAVAAGVLALYLLVFFFVLQDSGGPAAGDSTTTTTGPQPTATDATTSTTSPATTTTSSTTTSTTIAPIEPAGDPIPLADLQLGAFALGPLDLDSGSTDALGRLVATFGQPDAQGTALEADGLCPGSTGSTYRWGGLTVILLDEEEGQTLVGYRLAATPSGEPHDTDTLATLSGLRLGQTVADVRSIYANSGVEIIERDGSPHFILERSADQRTLLWGPVDSADDTGIVEGIFSPLWCDAGPQAP
jgi:hypothetical protein